MHSVSRLFRVPSNVISKPRLKGYCPSEHARFIQVARLILIGAPGSGKGTQAVKLHNEYGVQAISSGDLLRKVVAEGGPLGTEVAHQMENGGLVSDKIILQLIQRELDGKVARQKGWVLDGFPRTLPQAEKLDAVLEEMEQPLQAAFYLAIDENVIFDRIKDRWIHAPSGRTYSPWSPPRVEGKDDVTGEPLVKRADDTLETIRLRLQAYHQKTNPVLNYYESKGRLITIPSPNSDVGYARIKEKMQDLLDSWR
eukprot:TRINITY_DN27693_c0_g1_i1.p1 TRINITY_DN27693_c0_g1~~TRINITY_DN27693_c0_g1_i1.p1  ORF type:complete len:254 (-),score=62.45 TRINITY_DN27693_c0_g1_i1:469-1230(-)